MASSTEERLIASSSRAPGSHFNKSSHVSNLISFGRRLFSSFLGISETVAFSSALFSVATGVSSALGASATGLATSLSVAVNWSKVGFSSEIGCSLTLFSVSSNCFNTSGEAVVGCSDVAGDACSVATAAVVVVSFAGIATSSARAWLANKTEPIIKEQAPTDNFRIL